MSCSYASWWFLSRIVVVLIMELCRIWEELWAAFQCGKLRLQTLRCRDPTPAPLSSLPKLPSPSLCLFNLVESKPDFFGVLWKSLYVCTIMIDRVWNPLRCTYYCAALSNEFQFLILVSTGKARPRRSRVAKRSSEMKVGESSCAESHFPPTFALLLHHILLV